VTVGRESSQYGTRMPASRCRSPESEWRPFLSPTRLSPDEIALTLHVLGLAAVFGLRTERRRAG